MDILLNGVEVRVLGSLIEKSMTTPEYYPLSLNALTNACNQKSNRQLWRCGQKTNESECLNRNYKSYEVISMNYGMICRSLKESLSEKDRLKVRG